MKEVILSGILGFAVGDALGVPVEFTSRESLHENPVVNMREFGTHRQPKGTWSDDTSMTLCTMESLLKGLDYEDILYKFAEWLNNGFMTAGGNTFDVGIGTQKAIFDFLRGDMPLECGGSGEYDNGNGSLMRILPLAFYTMGMPIESRIETVENISSLTHAHKRSKIACSIYVQFACELLNGALKEKALKKTIMDIKNYYEKDTELKYYSKIINGTVLDLSENEIKSSGYVVDTLEAVLWAFFNTDNYKDCVLKAVNLGDDTDTVAAIVGGIAGIYYGADSIPSDWLKELARIDDIKNLCERFSCVCMK